MFKLAINAGHWKDTTRGIPTSMYKENGKRLDEWTLNARVVDAVIKKLDKYDGIQILRVDDPTGVVFKEDYERYGAANNWGADFYLGIHHNGGMGGGTGGGIVSYSYTYDKFKGDTSYTWSKELYNALVKHTGLKGNRSTPIARNNLFEVRETNMPAVLLELGFMDSITDIKYITNKPTWANNCADAIVEVIVKRAKLKEKKEVFKKGQKSLGIHAMKFLLKLALQFKLVPKNVADDGGYGDGVDVDVKAIQKLAGLDQKSEADEATIRAIYVRTLDALNAERKNSAAALKKAQSEAASAKASLASVQKKLDSITSKSGDVDGDGLVTMKDLLALRKLLAKANK